MNFKEDDLVLVKMDGFPLWPAKVIQFPIQKPKKAVQYTVSFFPLNLDELIYNVVCSKWKHPSFLLFTRRPIDPIMNLKMIPIIWLIMMASNLPFKSGIRWMAFMIKRPKRWNYQIPIISRWMRWLSQKWRATPLGLPKWSECLYWNLNAQMTRNTKWNFCHSDSMSVDLN